MRKGSIAVGFYQNVRLAERVRKALKKKGFARVQILEMKRGWWKRREVEALGRLVLPGEALVRVEVEPGSEKEAVEILRDEGGHPASFLFKPDLQVPKEKVELLSVPMTLEELRASAEKLAAECSAVKEKKNRDARLLKRLKLCEEVIDFLHHDIALAESIEQTPNLSSEWLLDNMYVIKASIEEIQKNLPKKYYRELPRLLSGLPRVYAIAREMVKDTSGKLSQENIISFLNSYQAIHPLKIGELWALPLMLRLALIESITSLALIVDQHLREGELASFWGNRLLHAAHLDPKKLPLFLSYMQKEIKTPSPHFADELLGHLFDEDEVIRPIKKWFEDFFQAPLSEVLHKEQMKETVEQVAFSSSIVSLITLSQLSWPKILESVSAVDRVLRQDPEGTYCHMDFATRDRYRQSVEKLAKRSTLLEVGVAEQALKNALSGEEGVKKHLGYYLVDEGLPLLEKEVKYRPTFLQGIQKTIKRHPAGIYIGLVSLITLLLEASLFLLGFPLILLLLALVLASEIAVQLTNAFVVKLLPPELLCKMDYSEKIPEACKTLVVVPTLLLGVNEIKEELNRLEIRYLANTDPALSFALFSDYKDADQKEDFEDKELLQTVLEGIKELERKYGPHFYLFHRSRKWSPCENKWIGWERKRGKIETLNRFLMGEKLEDSIVYYGNESRLTGTKYVITLDADTQLPKDKGKEMIEVLNHPLNRPCLKADKKSLARGYTIIQPRVSTDYAQTKSTLFSLIFSEPFAMDPYTHAVSNLYQDLTHEATYHGKGIYDVEAFHSILSGRYPQEHLLSHDLLEGAYARVGFASDICLWDTYPDNYYSWAMRQNRWIRGDFQIVDWLFPRVPLADGKSEPNPLSAMNRWKIFDNLRRAFLPAATFLFLLSSWTLSLYSGPVIAFTLLMVFLPSFLHFFDAKTFYRALITFILVPFEACIFFDAFTRVLYRRKISRRHLLQWTPSSYKQKAGIPSDLNYLNTFLSSAVIGMVVYALDPSQLKYALPFLILWAMAPMMVRRLNQPYGETPLTHLSEKEKKELYLDGRLTWRYFDDFMGPESHWLPPDNYQSGLKQEVADRTSPTNIGLGLISILSAYDLRFIPFDNLIERLEKTMETLKKLERFKGHFLNWYNILTLGPLYPRYISTVDSGNLLASFWTLEEGIREAALQPLIPPDSMKGILALIELSEVPLDELRATLERGEIKKGAILSREIKLTGDPRKDYWLKKIQEELSLWETMVDRYQSVNISLVDLARVPSSSKSQWLAGEMLGRVDRLLEEMRQIGDAMDFKFLYNEDRKLYVIGYNCDDQRLDSSYYDLLASEARIASLVAIAKGDIPVEHWWALGRSYTHVDGYPVLLSWGGTMFEYLMPLIFNKHYTDSLIGETCKAVVIAQMNYGKKRGIPWGISEAAHSAIDAHKTYQYRSFGIPEVGLKRDLEEDLVVSPYSTALALNVDPLAAMKNLVRLASAKGPYGYYESIDYTRQRDPSGKRGVCIYAYMAHHQGMILASIDNALNDNILPKRFHNDPRVGGVESLLFERVPKSPPVKLGGFKQKAPLKQLMPFSTHPLVSGLDTPYTVIPKVNLLSNGQYSVMTTNAGGGFSSFQGLDISRFSVDFTKDDWGRFFYIKDVVSKEIWSTTLQPTLKHPAECTVNFKPDKTEYKRKDHHIETMTEIFVTPEDPVEVTLITLTNHDSHTRILQITSYIELALAPHASDRAHPAFNKFFIETHLSEEPSTLLATRRPRSSEEKPIWAFHRLATTDEVQSETDREKFIGRGRTLKNPLGVERGLSTPNLNSLDPIFSLQQQIEIPPEKKVQIAFVTGVGKSREEVLALVAKYKDLSACLRGLELAWNYSQLELRHLRIHVEEAQLFQMLASRIFFPHRQLRASGGRLKVNKLGPSGLWAQGISGDLPIVVVLIGTSSEMDFVREILIAHTFWSLRGLKVDLVILNEEETAYQHPIEDNLQKMILVHSQRNQPETPGGVFVRNSQKMPEDELNLILLEARAVMVAARGPLRQQLVSPLPPANYAKSLVRKKNIPELPSRPLPFLELPYFNGLGGYSVDGKEYVIYLGPETVLPAPWINVIANPQFGTLVSETGLGSTWYGNSQSNRLTPWSNDPVLNPISDTIYLRDNEMGTFWTPTPGPIRELDPYRVSHGQGYSRFEHNSHGLEQELHLFVPMNQEGGLPLRIQKLTLFNNSPRNRILSATSYADWVLGSFREEAMMHVYTEWDQESQALFAWNKTHPDFGNCVAFTTTLTPPDSYTGDRTEFIGRNRTLKVPDAMMRESLSARVGGGLDPCGAIQKVFSLPSQGKTEVVFIMGYAKDVEEARRLIALCREEGRVESLYQDTKEWWNNTLGTLQVDLADLALTFTLNRWLVYQTISCRMWGRSAFYQSSGAYGFRDQLQDTLCSVYFLPEKAREYILYAASRQFVEGDVQHWWHPQSGGGVRTRFTDDRLWLPYVVAHYVQVTGDRSILDVEVPFLQGLLLESHQHEIYSVPTVSKETGTLLEHCHRAIQISLGVGAHGLSLMGGGDWNDGMNRVGIEGRGESVWMVWFLARVLQDFAALIGEGGEEYLKIARSLAKAADNNAWNGLWYLRAYFDDGSPLGASGNPECSIDSVAQSWATLSRLADPEKAKTALQSAVEHLVLPNEKLVLLLKPPFNHSYPNPGYIMAYPPGVRENGAQYTHGTLWLAQALAESGDPEKAVSLLKIMHPASHTENPPACELFRLEPYVLAADIYALEHQMGRGGWSWYTGSSAWMYRIYLESILGFHLRGNTLHLAPNLPPSWPGYTLQYRYKSTPYQIHVAKGPPSCTLDGTPVAAEHIPLIDDGNLHLIEMLV